MRRSSLTLLSLLPVMAAWVSLAGCSSPNGPPGPTGTLTGTLHKGGTADCKASGPVTVAKGLTSSVEVDCQEM